MSNHIATSENATMEQLEFSNEIADTLVSCNKITLPLKNIWKKQITRVLVETCCNPYPNLYDEIGAYCEEKDFSGYGVKILKDKLREKIKKDKSIQGEEATQSLEEYFIFLKYFDKSVSLNKTDILFMNSTYSCSVGFMS
jgi:hypothetical protein